LFDQSLCDQRWSLAYYKSNQRIFRPEKENESDNHLVNEISVLNLPAPKRRVLSQFEKFNRASKITTKLASLASEESGSGFQKRIAVLEKITSAWRQGKEVDATECVSSSEGNYDDIQDRVEIPEIVEPLQEEVIENEYRIEEDKIIESSDNVLHASCELSENLSFSLPSSSPPAPTVDQSSSVLKLKGDMVVLISLLTFKQK
jgi:hypothetical protein